MHETIVFYGATLIVPTGDVQADLVVQGTKIKEIRQPQPTRPQERVVDCTGCYLGPGLIDIHVHGGAGHDFVSGDAREIAEGARYHLSQGTTGIVPTALSVPFADLDRSIRAAKDAAAICDADILGYHVEGIYLDQEYRGGHLSEYVHNPVPDEYEAIIASHGDFIREWTLAPELPGAIPLIRACRDAGIVPSAGHTQATYEQMMEAIEAGLKHATHFACVMGNLRFEALGDSTGKGYAPGVIETVLLRDELTTEVIADGFHLHPGIIRLAVKCKGRDGVCLVSDAMKGVGLPAGEYEIGGQVCLVQNNIAIIKDRPAVIASSVTPLVGMLRFASRMAGLPLPDAWTMASLTPAQIIGVSSDKGSLETGKDADLLILDQNLAIVGVYAKGRKVDGGYSPAVSSGESARHRSH